MTIFGHFVVYFGHCHGNGHEYMKNDGTNGKPMEDTIGLDTLGSFLTPLLLKKDKYILQHLGPSISPTYMSGI